MTRRALTAALASIALAAGPAVADGDPARADVLTDHAWSVGVVSGSSLPLKGLDYNAGFGVRVGATVAVHSLRHVYIGGILAAHSGKSMTIAWGATTFGPAGDQHYTSHPVFVAADAGYSFDVPAGKVDLVVTPCLSAGYLRIGMDTDGIYGTTSIANNYALFGFGVSAGALFGDRFFVGAHFRLYGTGDTTFSFGHLDQNQYQHGFSTSVFYDALFAELGYRF